MKKLLLLFILIATQSVAQQTLSPKIQHLEPANWWVGMNEPFLQLLVHGENIAEYSPSLKYKGVELLASHKTDNPNYLFLDLQIGSKTKAGSINIHFNKDNDSFTQEFELKERKSQSAGREGFNTSDAIYLITPDRFVNGDPSNDTVEGYTDALNRAEEYGRHGGDIQGMINSLDYIADLGFTAIWPMPLEENEMDQWSYHGYAITDFYQIDPRFGSNESYVELSQKASQKGLKLIKDVVLNHCGSGHWWMDDMPAKDWINYGGEYKNTNHRREVVRDIHAAQADKELYTRGWFVESMPDMNQQNPMMANYLIQNCIWWIETAELGGFRVDTYPYSDASFLSRWSKRIMTEYPNFNITSEEWSTNPAITSYWQKGKQNPDGYQSYVPTPMDFPLQEALVKGLNEELGWNTDLNRVYHSVSNDFLYADASKLLIFPDNHDMSRIYTQLHENDKYYKMAMVMMATMRGIPQIYYGTEVLMANPNSDSHGEIRGEFPGGWSDHTANAFTGQNLTEKQKEAQKLIKTLFNYRKNTPALHEGKLLHFTPENGVYVYFRYTDSQKVMVIFNKNPKTQQLDLTRFAEMLEGISEGKDILSGETVDLKQPLTLDMETARVIEIGG
ncbi:glycoside hydrolase family 13 protein [Jiulongibacter sediminis]|uniref:Alpha-amlyase n=1 Tax=Jiulongibacter sediminis TaxID=1605367 RepID=A0A0N8H9S4_9BACT|nr:glycoside hydrolase family 13 protein [Jiulongibacter sediminis]KPM48180.1 alpha-amlyase [Jiulongibacter sediminis]TBX24346.1 alpha-amlyase [Jiulongibacter sediminis]